MGDGVPLLGLLEDVVDGGPGLGLGLLEVVL